MQQKFWKSDDKNKSYVQKHFWIGIFYRKLAMKEVIILLENFENLNILS